jgi:hypothetical protein
MSRDGHVDRSYTGWGGASRGEHGGHDSLEMAMNPLARFGILLLPAAGAAPDFI